MSGIVIITISLNQKIVLVRAINILSINPKPEVEQDLVKIIEDATEYFPRETWDEIECVGKLVVERDVKIAMNGVSCEALPFEKLVKRVGGTKTRRRLGGLVLGVAWDPVVAVYHYFDAQRFRRAVYLVHDYVTDRIGFASLFRIDDESSRKVVAHGLGHSRGLHHHMEPIDFMYSGLLSARSLEVEGFCGSCLQRLAEGQRGT